MGALLSGTSMPVPPPTVPPPTPMDPSIIKAGADARARAMAASGGGTIATGAQGVLGPSNLGGKPLLVK